MTGMVRDSYAFRNDIFGKEYDQKEIVLAYIKALKVRDSMVLNENEHSLPGLQYWAQAHQDQQDQGQQQLGNRDLEGCRRRWW